MFPSKVPSILYFSPSTKPQPTPYPKSMADFAKPDQVYFGASSPDMPFTQNHAASTAGTLTQPVSPNNCLVCSAKNLLAYFGYPKATIDNVVHDSLQNEIKSRKYFTQDSPYYQQANQQAVELNNAFVRTFMTSSSWGLNMAIEPLRIHQLDKIRQAITDRKALWVFAEGDRQTLAANARKTTGGQHQLSGGHAYVVIPDRQQPDGWIVLDSWAGKTHLSTRQLKQNLDALKKDDHSAQSQYNIVHRGPDPELMHIYEEKPVPSVPPSGNIRSPKTKPQSVHTTAKPAQKAPVWQKIKSWCDQLWKQMISIFAQIKRRIESWF